MHIHSLPEEILSRILEYLDRPPPSRLKARSEPNLDITISSWQPLKCVSLVSQQWRRIALPQLFRHARLFIDPNPRPQWKSCPVCGTGEAELNTAAVTCATIGLCDRTAMYHRAMMGDIGHVFTDEGERCSNAKAADISRHLDIAAKRWHCHLYHSILDFTAFISSKRLATSTETVAVLVGDFGLDNWDLQLEIPSAEGTIYASSTAFWQHLLGVIEPLGIVIVASPRQLACLTNASIITTGDWIFSDTEHHLLELRKHTRDPLLSGSILYAGANAHTPHREGFAHRSIVKLRQWRHIGINEGSFLSAYGSCNHFERWAPDSCVSIKSCFNSLYQSTNQPRSPAVDSLRTFTYTALFPFASHTRFDNLLPQLEELDVQLGPGPDDITLDDKNRVGRADLQDCWEQLAAAYRNISFLVSTFREMSSTSFPNLKKINCRDFQITALQEELGEIFAPVCLPVWAEYEPGVFERLAMSPRYS